VRTGAEIDKFVAVEATEHVRGLVVAANVYETMGERRLPGTIAVIDRRDVVAKAMNVAGRCHIVIVARQERSGLVIGTARASAAPSRRTAARSPGHREWRSRYRCSGRRR